MKFREEYKLIFPMNPDIIIIQECEDLRNIHFDLFSNTPSDLYWIGTNPSKGLGVITFNDYKISFTSYHIIENKGNIIGSRKATKVLLYKDLIKLK